MINWNWSFRLGRLWDVDIRIHWTLPAVFLFYVLRAREYGASWGIVGLFVALPYVLLFLSVLLHEYGHVFAARRCYLSVSYIILTPIGGMVLIGQARTPANEFFVAVSGPFVNLALGALAYGAYSLLGGPQTLAVFPLVEDRTFLELLWAGRYDLALLFDFVETQVFLFLFNVLMVAYPMDGGRILLAILWRGRGYHDALARSCRVARVLAIGMGLVGAVLLDIFFILIAFFVFVQATTTLQMVGRLADPSAGYDPGYERVWHEQQAEARGRDGAPSGKGFLARWGARRREKRLQCLLAKVRERGISSLSESDREFLRRSGGSW